MVIIREYKETDSEALQALFLNARRRTFLWTDVSDFKLSDFETETKGEYILVACIDDTIVGFISAWIKDNFIHHLYVSEKFQNQGIGTQLLKAVCAGIGSPVTLKCEEKNASAVRFYKQKGFREVGKGISKIGTYILFELNILKNESSQTS